MKKISYTIFLLLSCLIFCSANTYAVQTHKIADTVITAKVKSKIAMDPSLSVFKVDVSTKKGLVNLSGEVNSDTDASALVELTQSTNDVRDVNTRYLKIKNSQQPFTDTAITAKVKGTFIREKIFGNDISPLIKVETNNGIVYLSGNVNNAREITNAVTLAKTVNGVKHVESRLKVITS